MSKQYERHPLSARYKDLSGRAWDNFVAGMQEHGFDKDKPIILHEGKILEGWQRERACRELGIEAVYKKLPKGEDPEVFVERHNDQRRHEDPEQVARRVDARRERVAEARRNGHSLRTIAEQEGVDQKTIRTDLERSGVEGSTPENGSGSKVSGKDGKTYSATKTGQILCEKCKRFGVQIGCVYCLDAQKSARQKSAKEPPKKKPKQGAEKPTWKQAQLNFEAMVRFMDEFAKSYGVKEGVEHARCRKALDEFHENLKTWFKDVVKGAGR